MSAAGCRPFDRRTPRLAVLGLAAAAWMAAVPALAQSPASATSEPAPFTAGWRDGFVMQSEDGDFRLQIGLLVHADGRFTVGDEADAVADTFLIRRARPNLRGRLTRRFEFHFTPDFAGGTAVVLDAYLDTLFAPWLRIRAGKAKTPFGLERLHSAATLLFFERALPSSLGPNRDVGVQVLGDLRGDTVSYQAAVLNGVPDGASADADTTDSKDLAGRLVLRPFTRHPHRLLQGLGLAVSGTRGRQSGAAALPSFLTPSVRQPYYSYSGAAADGVRRRYSPQFFYRYGALNVLGEYVRTRTPVRRGSVLEAIAKDAWQIAASLVLTGEAVSDGGSGIRPDANVGAGDGGWGAVQVAARYHTLAIDERAFVLNLAAPDASRKVETWTVGLNWILTPNVKYVFNVERTVFDDRAPGARPPENGIVFRTQLNF